MKLACPSCAHALELPETQAGKLARCTSCQQNFVVPKAAVAAAVAEEELVLHDANQHEEVDVAPDPKTLQFCPNCGGKWRSGKIECNACHFNTTVNAVLKPLARKKFRLNFDVHQFSLIVGAIALLVGVYFLYIHFNDLRKMFSDFMDGAAGPRR